MMKPATCWVLATLPTIPNKQTTIQITMNSTVWSLTKYCVPGW